MKVAIIGYGKEGKANEAYFREHDLEGRKIAEGENEIVVIEAYRDEDYEKYDFSQYDLVLRSPSVRPRAGFSSGTQWFFDHCPVPIIGVTGTKGKGTTCTMIRDLLEALGVRVWLVGNIGVPAIEKLDEIIEATGGDGDDTISSGGGDGEHEAGEIEVEIGDDSIDKSGKYCVIYEMSSFQLWDLESSPHVAVILRIAPDHLNVHKDFAEYVEAKGRITEFQIQGDSAIYFRDSAEAREIAEKTIARVCAYPILNRDDRPRPPEDWQNYGFTDPEQVDFARGTGGGDVIEPQLDEEGEEKMRAIIDALKAPGQHNRENAEAALLAVAEFLGVRLQELVCRHFEELREAMANYQGLPHHIEFVRELAGVSYYDDSFSTAEPALEVAVKAFLGRPLVLIAGGQDKGVDLSEMKQIIFGAENLEKVFLLGEIAEKLAEGEDPERFEIVGSLEEAVAEAQKVAEAAASGVAQGSTELERGSTGVKQGSTGAADAEADTRLIDGTGVENASDAEKTTRLNGRTGVRGDGPVVLMSPGASSLDMFKNYYERGEEFQRLVHTLELPTYR